MVLEAGAFVTYSSYFTLQECWLHSFTQSLIEVSSWDSFPCRLAETRII